MSRPDLSARGAALPILTTARLTLRAHAAGDLDECAAMWADPMVTRYIGGKALSREEVWTKLLRYRGHWAVLGFGFWVVQETTSGRFAGEVGLADFKRDIQPSLDGSPEAGWVLASWAHGQGFATEAVRAVHGWSERHLPSARTFCVVHPANLASIRVAEKCGYRECARTTYKGDPVTVFERPAAPAVAR
jgi:RimJ/RimL family protein N-acetyltransferase